MDGRVLVVDDSLSVRRAIERMLSPKGLTVAGATGGGQALAWLAEERPELVICDVMLPEVDGYEVCRFVRGQPALAGVPVLLISGVSSPEVEARAAAAGAAGVLAKPFTAETLLARIAEIVSLGRGAEPEPGRDGTIEEVLAQAARLPGFRSAYALEPDGGASRAAGGGPAPAALVAVARHLEALTRELGLGGPAELFVEGRERTLVAHRIGRAVVAVCFDPPVRLGLARHLVRLLVRRAQSLTPHQEGEGNGHRRR